MKYTRSQKIIIAEKVAELYQSDVYTLASCCEAVHVDYDTFRGWAAPSIDDFETLSTEKQKSLYRRGFVPEIHSIIRASKQKRKVDYNALVLDKAYEALMRLIQGFHYETRVSVERVDSKGKMKPYRSITTVKYRPPSTPAIIFVLERLDPAFSGKPGNIVEDNDAKERKRLKSLSDEELDAEYARLQTELIQLNANRLK